MEERRRGEGRGATVGEEERKILFLARLPAKIGGPWNLIISTSVGNSGLFMSVLCSTAARLCWLAYLGRKEGNFGMGEKKKIRVEEVEGADVETIAVDRK